ncbi:MAG TPA: DUF6036 family nucleotidyltransferase [Polyangiaceae bacterium]|nr:DUF6036 family nucleotidyltransferase [Polyangiaceae bacterium]
MRAIADAARIRRFIEALGRRARSPGIVYLTGGATAVLHGFRPTTIDVDIKMDPEPAGAFEAIASLKDELDINVELASPDQFVPAVPGWQERSLFIAQHGPVKFLHYDPITQALSKIERGDARDLADVRALIAAGLVDEKKLVDRFGEIVPQLPRYPAIDVDAFESKVRAFVGGGEKK